MATSIFFATEHPFILLSGNPKTDRRAQKFVRSHVMRKKNRARAFRGPVSSWVNENCAAPQPIEPEKDPDTETRLAVPRGLGSDLSLVQFAEEMKPYMLEAVATFFTVIKRTISPLERVLARDPQEYIWLTHLEVEAVAIHCLVFLTHIYGDLVARGEPGTLAVYHFTKALALLQKRLSSADGVAISDPILASIISLAQIADARGQHDEAMKHVQGMRKMVNLRGGLGKLQYCRTLQFKICRTDLTVALNAGRTPLFFDGADLSWDSYLPDHSSPSSRVSRLPPSAIDSLVSKADPRLANTWHDLREFTRSTNVAAQTNTKVDPRIFHEIMISVLYRLLKLSFDPGSVDEAIRAGMVLFGYTIYTQRQDILTMCGALKPLLRNSLPRHNEMNDCTAVLSMWMLVVGAIVAFEACDEEWWQLSLVQAAKRAGVTDWKGARALLKDVLWVDVQHDKWGEEAFHGLKSFDPAFRTRLLPAPLEIASIEQIE